MQGSGESQFTFSPFRMVLSSDCMEVFMKKLIILSALLLFVIGFLVSPLALSLTESLLRHRVVASSVGDDIKFKLTISVLLALCAPAGGAMALAFSRRRPGNSPVMIFVISLIISLLAVCAGLFLRVVTVRNLLSEIPSQILIRMDTLSYFIWGFGMLLIVVVGVVSVLLRLTPSVKRLEG